MNSVLASQYGSGASVLYERPFRSKTGESHSNERVKLESEIESRVSVSDGVQFVVSGVTALHRTNHVGPIA